MLVVASSPVRRRLVLLSALAALFSLAGLAPLPPAQSQPNPPTVARTVDVPLVPLGNPAARIDGDTILAVAALRTPFESVCSPIWSTMVAFAWHQTDGGEVLATLETETGAPVSVLQDQDADPDPGTPEYHPDLRTSPLYWTRGTRCVRLSLRMPAGVVLSDLRATFINTSGTSRGPGTGPKQSPVSRALGFFGGMLAAPSAEAMTAKPHMVTRKQWGAMDPRPNCFGYADEIKMAYVHHTSGTNDYSPSQSDDIMRGIQYYHEHDRGYCDIAYSFLVDRFGTIFVGRAGSTTTNVNPGSQAGFNEGTFSVSAMGNFQNVPPPQAVVNAIERVVAWRLDVAHLPPTGTARMTSTGGPTTKYKEGTTVTLPLISGHRETGITDCPGNYLWDQLPQIRKDVYALGRPKFFRPRQSRTTITPLVDSMRFRASATDPLAWEIDIANVDGDVVRSLHANGTSLDVSWDGTDDGGLPLTPGTYTATMWGQTTNALVAREAVFPVAVNPEPDVSPSPSPSVSPSPSESPSASPSPS